MMIYNIHNKIYANKKILKKKLLFNQYSLHLGKNVSLSVKIM